LLGDYIGRLPVMAIGLFLSAVSYLLVGPVPILAPLLGPHMSWVVWVALGGVGIGAGMTFVPSLPALLHATRTLVRRHSIPRVASNVQPAAILHRAKHGPST
jgi:MFS family permease